MTYVTIIYFTLEKYIYDKLKNCKTNYLKIKYLIDYNTYLNVKNICIIM